MRPEMLAIPLQNKVLTPEVSRCRVLLVSRPRIVYGGVDVDTTVKRAVETLGTPVRIRMQPQVRCQTEDRPMYCAWRGVHWTVECTSAEEVYALRDALVCFFNVVAGMQEQTELGQALDRLKAAGVESAPSAVEQTVQ